MQLVQTAPGYVVECVCMDAKAAAFANIAGIKVGIGAVDLSQQSGEAIMVRLSVNHSPLMPLASWCKEPMT
jgi:hypothetical protein